MWSTYEENRDLLLMGAYVSGNDPVLDEAIVRREAMLRFLRQSPAEQIGFEASRDELLEEFAR
jgi:flagellum-specific ATP synthase